MRTCMGRLRTLRLYIKKNFCIHSYVHYRYRYHYRIIVFFLIVFILMASSSPLKSIVTGALMDTSVAALIRVDQSGKGDFTTIQAAIDSIPNDNNEFVFILIKPGTYREKVVVPINKPYVTLSGTKATNTIITWNDGGNIYESPTLSIMANQFVGRYLTIENTYGTNGKGVALRVTGDEVAFYSCRVIGFQDTLLDDLGRHYYFNCYIEGSTDFICGNAVSLFQRCHLHSIHRQVGYASITAQKRESESEDTGFIFLGCKITGIGVGNALLGRPWGAYSRVIFAYSFISSAIAPIGWDNWGDINKESTAYYGEYKCYGPGSDRSKRVAWSKGFTKEQVEPFLTKDMIGGRDWLRPSPTNFKKQFH